MSTFLEILGTSTPVSEVLAQKLGYVKAAIACRIFFYEQLEHKVCEASIGTIAKKLGMSTGAVSTNINWLLEEKYIKVIGKYRKGGNQPNKFKVAKRFYVEIQRSSSERQRSSSERQRSSSERQRSADEIKRREKEEKKEETTSSGDFSLITKTYENEIGLLSPIIADKVKDCSGDYPTDWIVEAIGIAASQNKRRWAYVEGILKKWKTEGRGSKSNGKKKEREKMLDPITGEWTGGYYS